MGTYRRCGESLLAVIVFCAALMLAFTGVFLNPADAAATLGRPTAKAPSGAVAIKTPTFKWGRASRSASYEVRVWAGTHLVLKKVGISRCYWTSSKGLPESVSLKWKVRGRKGTTIGPWSKTLNFKVTPALKVGDVYQGGKIAYILAPGDPGYVQGETRGLIAAPYDLPAQEWTDEFSESSYAFGLALGTGWSNTIAICGQYVCERGAAHSCFFLDLNGYSDWFLPSKDELGKLYANREAIGGFSNTIYWSSSEYGPFAAWCQSFGGTAPCYHEDKDSAFLVRPVRSFPSRTLSSDKSINSFTYGQATGVIDQVANTIAVTFPKGTDLSVRRTLTIGFTGAWVGPPSGFQLSFSTIGSGRLACTVTAEDGTTRDYTLYVVVASQ